MDKNLVDILWVAVCSTLVFAMQAGFLCLETGLCRSKNFINVAIKNLIDAGICVLIFWAVGYAFMFGTSANGIIGLSGWFQDLNGNDLWKATFFVYQTMFCSTAVTILSGAVAERMRIGAYCASVVVISALIYPVFGHWVWSGALTEEYTGWLGRLGFVDFAGSSVVHSLGGWISLAALLHIGPRTGRFPKDGPPREIPGANVPFAVLGCMILWIGWIGFNGGSTFAFNLLVPKIIANTLLGGCAGMVACLIWSGMMGRHIRVDWAMNGVLAGCVSITAGCHAFTTPLAVLVGAVGGILAMVGVDLLERRRIDDAVSAVPVHLMAGVWGTLAVGLFGDVELLGTGLTRGRQILAQLTGIAAVGVWAFTLGWLMYFVMKKITRIRVTPEEERVGLNVSEHGAQTETLDFFLVMDEQARTGNLSLRVPEEPFTEVGMIAARYNEVMSNLERMVARTEAIVKSSMDAILVVERDSGVLASVNPAGLELLRRKEGELEGTPLTRSIRLESDAADSEAMGLLERLGELAESRQRVAQVLTRPDGTQVPVETAATLSEVQGARFYTVTLSDISERRDAEEKLRAGRREKDAIFEAVSEGVFIIDESGRISEANPSAMHLFRSSMEALRGRFLWDIVFPERLRERVRYGVARLVANPRDPVLGKPIRTSCTHQREELPVEIVFRRIQTDMTVGLVVLIRPMGATLSRGTALESLPF
ncbi:MAG: ammonium transporter [Candidatus Sumerlaeia bacterium]|nr:ammonium transporter [Candidatus Sumerlaeia bacterium]